MPHPRTIFATENDTIKLIVAIQYHFILHNYTDKRGESKIQLTLTGQSKRVRINTGVNCSPEFWDKKKERVSKNAFMAEQTNLILDNIVSKITRIKTTFHLTGLTLTPNILAKELTETTSRVDFLKFFKERIEKERSSFSPGYFKKVKSVLYKMQRYLGEVYFSEITEGWLDNYRALLAEKNNKKTTINSNMATIKRILNTAQKEGIQFPLNPQYIKVGSTIGSRIDLNVKEIEMLFKYYLNEFCPEHWRLTLGYFLFSCFTGMRLSDVLDLDRKCVMGVAYVEFLAQKTKKRQLIPITQKCAAVINHLPDLFVQKVTPQQMNRNLKHLAVHLRIRKNITFHLARHTFATNFLRAGGNVVNLQKLLGHSNIRETMVYVHIVEQEANDQINLMDNLF